MGRETVIEAGSIPGLSQLVETIIHTCQEQVIALEGKPVARMIPLRRQANVPSLRTLVDTSALPPIPDDRLDELLTRAPGTAPHSFTDDEIGEAVDLDRVEAWHAKRA